MRFTLIKNLKNDSSMKPIIIGLLVFMLLYIIADIVVKQSLLGLMPQHIYFTLFGNEEEFLDPLTTSSFLEIWHSDIFFTMIILLTLSAVYARLSQTKKLKLIIINSVMLSGLTALISLVSSFYISSAFIYPYIISYFLWHLLASYMIVVSLWGLND